MNLCGYSVEWCLLFSYRTNISACTQTSQVWHQSCYAIPLFCLACRQIPGLDVCWNSVIPRIFGYHK